MRALESQIEAVLDVRPARFEAMSGGLRPVYRVTLDDGQTVVAKTGSRLDIEGYMLTYLAEHSRLPVPAVLFAADDLLLLEYIASDGFLTAASEQHAAELLAALHDVRAPAFGFERDTLIGGLDQPNGWTDTWVAFFRERRLLYMAGEALRAGRLPAPLHGRIERLAAGLETLIDEPEAPSLLHGDIWGGNVLAGWDRITGFLDPAVYFGHAEIELAFITLFHTFGQPFFERYHALRPIEPGFFEARRDLYNLYPLLVHVRLFGGGYVGAVERIVARFGL